MMPPDREAVYVDGFVLPDSGFAPGYIQLLLHGVHTLQVREQEAQPSSALDDDPKAPGVELGDVLHRFRLTEDIYAYLQVRELLGFL